MLPHIIESHTKGTIYRVTSETKGDHGMLETLTQTQNTYSIHVFRLIAILTKRHALKVKSTTANILLSEKNEDGSLNITQSNNILSYLPISQTIRVDGIGDFSYIGHDVFQCHGPRGTILMIVPEISGYQTGPQACGDIITSFSQGHDYSPSKTLEPDAPRGISSRSTQRHLLPSP